ncbi:hypothetical protein GOODEAATRI_002052 [Goodea atripinnis]|uniref:Uncharacterized protein n=1 Tax=Goodea atripinnis TaxID=208336 RepID=A0ABV0NJ78_9TELE
MSESSQTSHLLLPSSATVSPNKHFFTTASTPLLPVKSDGDVKGTTVWQWSPSSTVKPSPPGRPPQAFHPSQPNHFGVTSALIPTPNGSLTKSPIYYIVPNQPATIRVQSLVVFKTSEALQWLSVSGPTSLLERTGLAQAVHQGKMFRSSRITNITVGDPSLFTTDWSKTFTLPDAPPDSNAPEAESSHLAYCTSVLHRPIDGDDFWYMGQRCDMKMTRARLISASLAILIIIVMVIGILACLAVRRYRTILIQAKVDQTRSRYSGTSYTPQ